VVHTILVVVLYTWIIGVCLLLLVGIGLSRQRARRRREGAEKPTPEKVAPKPTELHIWADK
jgi:UPF0716 family protein affecting phage T7 exclusion